ncbi:MAG: hypothetical protein KF912_14275 [Phycisphaeraceae bacterium]|nr:hypothetical protein [Phycisphaeraceae bacterium]MBX3368472.1 hypothetical protein [Phycisphaeraceae bacterium]
MAAALFVGIPLIAGLAYEGFIRWQAKVAARDRNVVQVLNEAMMAKSGTNERRGAANAWDAFERANLQRLYHDGDTWMISPGSQIVWPNFSLIYDQSTLSYPGRDDESKDRDLRSLALALQLIEEYRAIGLYSTLDEMAASPVALRLIEQQGRPLLQMMSPHLPDVRRLASISAARARLACRSDDLQEFASALDSGLALVRLLDHQLLRADQISAASIEFIVLERAMEMLSGPVNAKWVETIHEIMLRQLPSEPTLDWLDYDRAVRLDMIAWIFSDPSKSRFGRWSSFLKHYQGFRSGRSYPLGTYGGNVSAINRVYNGMLSYARTPIPERDVKSFEAEFSRGKLLLPDVYASPPLMELNIHERRVVMRRAAQAMVALERFRLATGSYPDDLADLVPHFIEEVPIDPWSDASLGYRRIDPSEDPHGRGYLLYSVGSDLTDNGGAPPDRRYRGTVLSTSPSQRRGGVDYIFNEPHFSESSGSTNRDE